MKDNSFQFLNITFYLALNYLKIICCWEGSVTTLSTKDEPEGYGITVPVWSLPSAVSNRSRTEQAPAKLPQNRWSLWNRGATYQSEAAWCDSETDWFRYIQLYSVTWIQPRRKLCFTCGVHECSEKHFGLQSRCLGCLVYSHSGACAVAPTCPNSRQFYWKAVDLPFCNINTADCLLILILLCDVDIM